VKDLGGHRQELGQDHDRDGERAPRDHSDLGGRGGGAEDAVVDADRPLVDLGQAQRTEARTA
jgi:hypothetical protein